MELVLISTSGQNILLMWDLLVMNGMGHSLMFCFVVVGALLLLYDDVKIFRFYCVGGSEVIETYV